MTEKQGLTGIKEDARGFVGRQPVYDKTASSGKSRIRFDIGCGKPDPDNCKYSTWRHCVAYGDKADSLRGLIVGDLVHVWGWVTTEAIRDDYMRPIIKDGKVEKAEYLILYKAEIIERHKVQFTLGVCRANE